MLSIIDLAVVSCMTRNLAQYDQPSLICFGTRNICHADVCLLSDQTSKRTIFDVIVVKKNWCESSSLAI